MEVQRLDTPHDNPMMATATLYPSDNMPTWALEVKTSASNDSSSDHPVVPQQKPAASGPRKDPMLEFEWGGTLVRKALPATAIPRWLDPLYVDVDDPRKLPLCWYGVPFVEKLVFGYAERVGLADYHEKPLLRLKAGDLDIFETWARLEVWFQKKSGLKLDWIPVWGERLPILAFWSNHELLRITPEMWGDVCDLIDDMGYGPEYELAWYLDRGLDY